MTVPRLLGVVFAVVTLALSLTIWALREPAPKPWHPAVAQPVATDTMRSLGDGWYCCLIGDQRDQAGARPDRRHR